MKNALCEGMALLCRIPFTKQQLLTMKLTAIMLLAACLQVSAGGYAQNVTLSEKNAPLEKIFQEIKKQTGYSFLYSSEVLKQARKVDIEVRDAPLTAVLNKCFINQPLTWEIDEKTIIVKPNPWISLQEETLLPIDVKGRITNENGDPIEGVTVTVKGTANGTATNSNGEFELKNVDENATLVLTAINIESREIKLAGRRELTIIAATKIASMTEVVVNKGYYSEKQKYSVGSVSTVTNKDIETQPIGDPILALQGRMAGLSISQLSGVPGASMEIKLRGQNSIGNGNDPLYIIDGVPFTSNTLTIGVLGGAAGGISPFSSISMNDIEKIEVLKDADATAIYGSRGANGVILITTKHGQSGKTKFGINVYHGGSKVANHLELLDTRQYLQMRHEAFGNDGASPQPWDYDINGTWDTTRYTDWQKVLIGGTGKVTDANATFSGGNPQTKFLFSGGYRKETTVFPGDYYNRKISTHFSLNHQSPDKKFQSSFSASFQNDKLNLPIEDFTSQIVFVPVAPNIYSPDGTLNWENSTWTNPFGALYRSSTSQTDNLIGALNVAYYILPKLSISARLGYNNILMNSSNITPFISYNPASNNRQNLRINNFGRSQVKSWIVEPGINYSTTIKNIKLESLIGATFQNTDQDGISQRARGFSSDALIKNIAAATTITLNSNNYTRYRYNAVFARIGINYEEKYLLNITGRRDASSRFGPGKQFGNFGSVGAAWIFSNENFLRKNPSFISFGKIRVSYGITGNDQLGDYKYLSTYSAIDGAYQNIVGLSPTQLTNPNYGWETVKKLEIGLDVSLWDNRVELISDWYRNRTGNQLVGYSLPSTTGFNTVQANLPAVIQNTGFEFEITTRNVKRNNFSWTTRANISIPENKLISYPNLEKSSYASRYVIGQPLFLRFLFNYTGIDPAKNIYTFEDVNKDGQITFAEDRKPVFVGQKFFGGINNSITFLKSFQFDFFFQFVKQTGFKYLTSLPPGTVDVANGNQTIYVFDKSKVQKLSQDWGSEATNAHYLFVESDGVVGDASFIRLKNISLSWNLPETIHKRLNLESLKVYVNAQNLWTITKYKGLDPESSLTGVGVLRLPPLKMLVAGISIGL